MVRNIWKLILLQNIQIINIRGFIWIFYSLWQNYITKLYTLFLYTNKEKQSNYTNYTYKKFITFLSNLIIHLLNSTLISIKSTIFNVIRYFIYKKYKFIGRFLSNYDNSKLINLFLIYIMFSIDNLILYYHIIQSYSEWGFSLEFLLRLEIKGCIIFLFNAIYSLSIGFIYKHICVKGWINSDYCYELYVPDSKTPIFCYVLFPFSMLGLQESIYYQGLGYLCELYEQKPNRWTKFLHWYAWVGEIYFSIIFIYPHFYFAKLMYTVVKVNSIVYLSTNQHFFSVARKTINRSSLETWVFIYLEFVILSVITVIVPTSVLAILSVLIKVNIIRKGLLYMYNSTTIREQIAQKDWNGLLLYLWQPYRFLGFFIKGYRVYTNSKILGYIDNVTCLKRFNNLKFLKDRGLVFGLHKFHKLSKVHLAYYNSRTKEYTGLTGTSNYNNLKLITTQPELYDKYPQYYFKTKHGYFVGINSNNNNFFFFKNTRDIQEKILYNFMASTFTDWYDVEYKEFPNHEEFFDDLG